MKPSGMIGWRLLLVLVAFATMVCCVGCIKINMAVAVAPDQSTSARLTAATAISLAEVTDQGGSPFAALEQQSGGKWKARTYQEGKWTIHEATGAAAPGEPLFPPDEGEESPKLLVQTSHRRLSMRYSISMSVPPAPAEVGQMPEMPKLEGGQDFSGLAESMMGEMEIRISLAGPGEVVATTGNVVAPGKAEWKLGFADLQGKQAPDFRVTTEIPNWDTLGNLANQLVLRGGPYDAGSRLMMALQRGLLPNPPLNAPAAEKLSAIDYLRLVEIIGKLDSAAGPSVTDVVIRQARLDDEDASSASIAAVHEKVMKMDVNLIVEQAEIQGLSKALK